VNPAAHVVQPAKFTPPHCAYWPAVQVGGRLGMEIMDEVMLTGTGEVVLVVRGRVVTVEKVVADEISDVRVRVKMGMSMLVEGSGAGAPFSGQGPFHVIGIEDYEGKDLPGPATLVVMSPLSM